MRKYMKRSTFTAPLLMLVVCILSVLSGLVVPKLQFTRSEDLFLAYTILEILIFVVPGIFYVKLKPRRYTAEMDLISFGFTQLPFVALMSLLLALGGILMSLLYTQLGVTAVDSSLSESALIMSGGDYITNIPNVIYVSLSLAVVPAFAEEFLFRGIFLKEYRMYGMLPSVLVTALLFAFLHFDFKFFPFYFLSGIVLGVTAYTARSTFASAIVHTLFNLFVLFVQPLVFNFLSLETGTVLVFYLATVLFLLVLMLAIGEGERLFLNYSTAGVRSYAPMKKRSILPRSLEIFTPTFFCCLLFFILAALRIIPLAR